MKRGARYIWILPLLIISMSFISAMACDLNVSMINQDPYPAIPGDYVKVVFQVDGVANPECGKIYFNLVENYPLIFDPGQNTEIVIDSGTYSQDFSSFLIAPYKVRIDSNALDGDNPIEVRYKYANNQNYETQQFNLNIKNNKADFEIYVKDYNPTTHIITFEILNTGKQDVKALTMEIPKQATIQIKGPNVNIVGDLDSNEYTTADFEAVPTKGDINVTLYYTDSIGVRRTLQSKVSYDPTYFSDRVTGASKGSIWAYLFWLVVIIWAVSFFYKRYKRKKKQKELHRR